MTKALQVSQQAFTFTGAPSASAKEDEFSQSWQSHGGEGERGDEGGGERAAVLATKDASIRQIIQRHDAGMKRPKLQHVTVKATNNNS